MKKLMEGLLFGLTIFIVMTIMDYLSSGPLDQKSITSNLIPGLVMGILMTYLFNQKKEQSKN